MRKQIFPEADYLSMFVHPKVRCTIIVLNQKSIKKSIMKIVIGKTHIELRYVDGLKPFGYSKSKNGICDGFFITFLGLLFHIGRDNR